MGYQLLSINIRRLKIMKSRLQSFLRIRILYLVEVSIKYFRFLRAQKIYLPYKFLHDVVTKQKTILRRQSGIQEMQSKLGGGVNPGMTALNQT